MKELLIQTIQECVKVDTATLSKLIEIPPKPQMGDFALPCFFLAKEYKKAPPMIAEELVSQIKESKNNHVFEKIESVGPYINFYVKPKIYGEQIIPNLISQKHNFAKKKPNNKNVVIDYSAPNVAKNMGIHNLRSTIIGQALYNTYSYAGFTTIGVNHLGDWGTQFGKLIWALEAWSSPEELEQKGILFLNDIYVKYHSYAEEHPQIEDEARAWSKKIEDGDSRATMWWQLFVEVSIKEYNSIYERLGVSFDHTKGESYYIPLLEKTLKEVQHITTMSDGALVVDLGESMPPFLLKRSDGGTLYGTRDLAAALYRIKNHSPHKVLYLVDIAQSLHFQQLFKTLEKIDPNNKDVFLHVEFGRLSFADGAMSTRKGNIVPLKEVLDKAKEKALEVINQKNPQLEHKDDVAEQIGTGAVIFGDLSHDRVHNIIFDWDKVLDFQGETAPYVQYTIARINSILEKEPESLFESEYDINLINNDEKELLKKVESFSSVIDTVVSQNKPHHIAIFAIQLAQHCNAYYANTQILNTDETKTRLAIIYCVKNALETALQLLGIKSPHKM